MGITKTKIWEWFEYLQKYTFTIFLFIIMSSIWFVSNSIFYPLTAEIKENFWFALTYITQLDILRYVSSAFITHGEMYFLRALLIIILVVGTLEAKIGSLRTLFIFFLSHIWTLLLFTIIAWIWYFWFSTPLFNWLFITHDVGPSAWYIWCFAALCALSHYRYIWLIVSNLILWWFLLFHISYGMNYVEIIADVLHIIAFQLWFFWVVIYGIYEKYEIKSVSVSLMNIFQSYYPTLLAFFVFLSWLYLSFEWTLPLHPDTEKILKNTIPLPFFEITHFLGSIIGILLIILSFWLKDRTRSSYYLSILLFISAILLSFVKWIDNFIIFLFILLLWLSISSRRYFYRKDSFLHSHINLKDIFLLFIVLSAVLWVWLILYKNVNYAPNIWLYFSWSSDASRFLRSYVALTLISLLYVGIKVLKAQPNIPTFPNKEEMDLLLPIIKKSKKTYPYLIFLWDKYILKSSSWNTFISFSIQWKSAIALKDPVWLVDEYEECILNFKIFCRHNALRCSFYEVSTTHLEIYLNLGFYLIKIWEEAKIRLQNFSLEWKKKQNMRTAQNKFLRDWYSFEYIPQNNISQYISELQRISHNWLTQKKASEKWFSLWKFSLDYISHFSCVVVKNIDWKIIAFMNLWEWGDFQEISWDIMRYDTQAPNWVMEFLFTETILWAKNSGYIYFDIWMAPLWWIISGEWASVWNSFASFIYNNWEKYYNFKWLRSYKEKFSPEWENRYIVVSHKFQVPLILKDISALISWGVVKIFKK